MANRLLDYETQRVGGDAQGRGEPFDPTARPGGDRTEWKDAIEGYIAANPGISLGVALLAGVLLGWIIKRR